MIQKVFNKKKMVFKYYPNDSEKNSHAQTHTTQNTQITIYYPHIDVSVNIDIIK